jgi:hypothetical protein
VWVRHTGAELAMATLRPPPTAPELPAEIDVAWAATGDPITGLRVLYRLERGGSWEDVTERSKVEASAPATMHQGAHK